MKMYGCAGRQLINIDSLPPTMGTISMPCTAFFIYIYSLELTTVYRLDSKEEVSYLVF